jgi:catechol 2,3-dioxygenase-like lactoylglutathione lyase family enzyme
VIRGLHHVGISVADLERTILFYRHLFGMQVIVRKPFSGPRYEAILGLSGVQGKLAVLRGRNLELELFEFSHPRPIPKGRSRPVCDHGITHICLEVANIVDEYERLKAAGVAFHSPQVRFSQNEAATYARDPEGNVLELLECNESKSAE